MPATYTPTTPVQLAAAYRRAVRTGNRAAARRYRAALRNGRGSSYATATAYGPAAVALRTYANPPRSMGRAQWRALHHALRAYVWQAGQQYGYGA